MRGLPSLVFSQLLGRVAGRMLAVSLVLFVLGRYHSPALAGAATAILVFPGLLVAPIAGALLDRHLRTRLIAVDYLMAACAMFAIAVLSATQALAPALLLLICGVASITGPLSWAGLRSMFPAIVPGPLWERANAVDTSSDVLASVIGAPLGGMLVALFGGEWALAAAASLFVIAGIAMLRVHDPAVKQKTQPVLAEAWSGLGYVVRDRSLVGLALTFITFGAGWGCLGIAAPVLVLGPLHQGPAVVGYILGAVGAAGFFASLFAGRINTRGRERQLMAVSTLAVAIAISFLPSARSVVVVALALIVVAIVQTPFDIAFLTLRQRRTDPARFGSMFAVSMALNQIGGPIGSAMAGPLIAWSLTGALWVAVALVAVSALVPLVAIPARD